MKKVITSIIAFLFFINLIAGQDNSVPKNSIKIGLGTAYLKPDNYLGSNTFYLQYEHRLFKPVRIALDGFRINAQQTMEDDHEKSIMAYQADAGLNIALFSNQNNALKIGGGGTWQTATNRFTTAVERDSNGNVMKTFAETKDQHFGWTASLEYEVYVVKHITLGTRFIYKNYQNGTQNYFFGLNAGFRF